MKQFSDLQVEIYINNGSELDAYRRAGVGPSYTVMLALVSTSG